MAVNRQEIQEYTTVAQLRAELSVPQGNDKVFVSDNNYLYDWDAVSTATDDGLSVIAQTSIATGRWLKIDRTRVFQLAANFTVATVTRATPPNFSFPVVAGKNYMIEIIASFTSTAAATGASIGVVLTGGGIGTIRGYMEASISAATVATALRTPISAINAVNTTANSFMTTTGVSAINVAHEFVGVMVFNCTTTGVFNVQYASETATSTTLLAGSTIIVTQLN